MLDFGWSWDGHLTLVEFVYNNCYQDSIGMIPFKVLYGRPCRSLTCLLDNALMQISITKRSVLRVRISPS